MKISCLIVDDEPPAVDLIERYVKKTNFLALRGICNSAVEAANLLNTFKVDLIFLDIQMPELTGIELSRMIKKETKVIFTTAFSNYAIESYKVNALDYLLKPFNYEEFLRAALKAREWFNEKQVNANPSLANPAAEENAIFVKSEYKLVKINLREVIHFEGLKDYIKIWLTSQSKPILTIMSLKSLEDELSPTEFMRVHRSFILSLNNIQSVEKGQAVMSNGTRITIADQYKDKFQEYLAKRSIKH